MKTVQIKIKADESEKQAIQRYCQEHQTDVTSFMLDLASQIIGFERVERTSGGQPGNTNASANPGARDKE